MKILILFIFICIGITVAACAEDDAERPMPATGEPEENDPDDNTATLIGPIQRADAMEIEFHTAADRWIFACSPENGGRITGFSLNGHQLLTDASVHATNYGSTFWTSPQSDWNWPPVPAVDSMPYTSIITEETGEIALHSEPETTRLNVRIEKHFQPDLTRNAMVLTYAIHNIGADSRSFAPWEITRVAARGMTFYPQGDGTPTGGSMTVIPSTQSDGITWIDYPTGLSGDQKLFSDGRNGWIAHTDGHLILIKTFVDEPASAAAPGEAEIEIYTNGTYVEVEQQGAWTDIPPAGELRWTVTWYLRELPADLDIATDRAELVQFVESVIH